MGTLSGTFWPNLVSGLQNVLKTCIRYCGLRWIRFTYIFKPKTGSQRPEIIIFTVKFYDLRRNFRKFNTKVVPKWRISAKSGSSLHVILTPIGTFRDDFQSTITVLTLEINCAYCGFYDLG